MTKHIPIAHKQKKTTVNTFNNVPWTNICDADSQSVFTDKYKINSIPYAMIIDTEGKIVKQIIGADSIEEYVRTLLE